jgi:hypothetical protein
MNHFDDRQRLNPADGGLGKQNNADDEGLESDSLPPAAAPLDAQQFVLEMRSFEPNYDLLNEAISQISAPFIKGSIGTPDLVAEHERLTFLMTVLQDLAQHKLDGKSFCDVLRVLRDTFDHEAIHRTEHCDVVTELGEWLGERVQEPRFLLSKTLASAFDHDLHSAALMLECLVSLHNSRIAREVVATQKLQDLVSSQLIESTSAVKDIVLSGDDPYCLLSENSDYLAALANVAHQIASPGLQEPLTELACLLSALFDEGELAEALRDSIESNDLREEEEDYGDEWDDGLDNDDDLEEEYSELSEDSSDTIASNAAAHLDGILRALVTCQRGNKLECFWEVILDWQDVTDASWHDALAGLFLASPEAARPYVTGLLSFIVRSLKQEIEAKENGLARSDEEAIFLVSRGHFNILVDLLLTSESAGRLIGEILYTLKPEEQKLLWDLAQEVVNDEQFSVIYASQNPDRSVEIDDLILRIFDAVE